jgi:hypothetical protein
LVLGIGGVSLEIGFLVLGIGDFSFRKLDLVWFFWICCSFDQQYKDTLPHDIAQEQNNPFIGVQ